MRVRVRVRVCVRVRVRCVCVCRPHTLAMFFSTTVRLYLINTVQTKPLSRGAQRDELTERHQACAAASGRAEVDPDDSEVRLHRDE